MTDIETLREKEKILVAMLNDPVTFLPCRLTAAQDQLTVKDLKNLLGVYKRMGGHVTAIKVVQQEIARREAKP
jgi:hypothetical protein